MNRKVRACTLAESALDAMLDANGSCDVEALPVDLGRHLHYLFRAGGDTEPAPFTEITVYINRHFGYLPKSR